MAPTRLTARAAVAVLVVAADALWVLVSVTVSGPAGDHLSALVAALTLAMVFVIQHTQAHTNAGTQCKHDELPHALPNAVAPPRI